jgi:5'-nucleotidase
MRILITNDDGIDAPGLAALEQACRSLPGVEVMVAAPLEPHSLCGHRVTTHAPLFLQRRGESRFAVEGTPADCVRIGLFALGLAPDLVVSGVNEGGNMGQDLVISGTVAAAREAAYHGIPAIAFSHYLVRGHTVDWQRAAHWVAHVLEENLGHLPGHGVFRNINLPHPASWTPDEGIPQRVMTHPARPPLPVHFEPLPSGGVREGWTYAGVYARRPAPEGSDVAACFGGFISVSEVPVQA